MELLVLNAAEVRRLLPMDACIELMREVLATLARGDAVQPLRSVMRLPGGRGLLGTMPAFVGGDVGACGVKVVGVCPQNAGTPYDTHQGVVLLFEPEHGLPVAVLDGSEVTAIRTAAVSGLATRLLAREDAHTLGILGSGTQARTHLDAIRAVRAIDRVRVWSRTVARARSFAEREARRTGLAIEAVATPREAVEDSDVVCTTTSATEPVLEGAWLAAGTHVNAVGACTPTMRELDAAAVARSVLFTDRRESLLHEAGDFLIARSEGAVGDDHLVGELGDVIIGRVRGRRGVDDVTLFESLGIGVEDVACAYRCHASARAEGLGTRVAFGGPHDAAD